MDKSYEAVETIGEALDEGISRGIKDSELLKENKFLNEALNAAEQKLKEAMDDRDYINDRCRKAEEFLRKAEEDIQRLEAELKQANLDRESLRDEMADMADELDMRDYHRSLEAEEIRVLLPQGTKLSTFRCSVEVAE